MSAILPILSTHFYYFKLIRDHSDNAYFRPPIPMCHLVTLALARPPLFGVTIFKSKQFPKYKLFQGYK
jgi:hypothetical protein